jgi:Putative adhesin
MDQKTIFLLLTICAASILSAVAASEERIKREVDVRPGGKLVFDVDFGTLDLKAGADNKVAVEAVRSIDFGNEAKEKEYLVRAPITITAENNIITMRARAPKEVWLGWFHRSRKDGRYTIRVPKDFSTDLNTGGGDITASELTGDMRADSDGGDLRVSHLRGALSARSGGGDIELDDCDGAGEINTGGGDIISIDSKGTLLAHSGGGTIEARNFLGDTDVSTGGGDLRLQRIDGAIAGETSGGSIIVSVSGTTIKKINLESSGGDIDLALPKSASANIMAQTSGGRITTNLPLEVTRADDEHLRARLNRGGPSVLLRTSGGGININSATVETAAR